MYTKQMSVLYKNGQYKKSDSIFNKKLFFLKKNDNLEEEIYAYLDYFNLQPINNRIDIISNLEKKIHRKPQTQKEQIAWLHLWVNQAYYLKSQGSIYQSIIIYEKALNYYDKYKLPYNILDFCLKPLANNCTRIGDYQRADDLMIRSLQIAILENDYRQIISFSNNLAISKQSQGHFKLAIDILKEALQTPTITTIQKSRIHSELAKNYYKTQNYSAALIEVEKTFLFQQDLQNKEQSILVNSYTTKGMSLIALK
jgi:tetratricopeptide (TPR) repeat protein